MTRRFRVASSPGEETGGISFQMPEAPTRSRSSSTASFEIFSVRLTCRRDLTSSTVKASRSFSSNREKRKTLSRDTTLRSKNSEKGPAAAAAFSGFLPGCPGFISSMAALMPITAMQTTST